MCKREVYINLTCKYRWNFLYFPQFNLWYVKKNAKSLVEILSEDDDVGYV